MFVLNIIILIITAIVAIIQLFKEYRKNQNITSLKIIIVLIIFGLGISILSELMRRSDELKTEKKRSDEYLSIIQRADTTLTKVDSNLNVSDSILGNTGRSIASLMKLQQGSTSLNDSMKSELKIQRQLNVLSNNLVKKSGIMLRSQEQMLQRNNQLLSGQNELATISLMDKFIVPKVRVVFSYKHPINSAGFDGPKFVPSQTYKDIDDYGRGIRADNIFPNSYKMGNDRIEYSLYLRLLVEGFVNKSIGVQSGYEPPIITTPYKEKGGRFCIAFEFQPNSRMNLAQFYNQVKNANSEFYIQKNYNYSISKSIVVSNETKFLAQDVKVYLEAPLDLNSGIWFKINLKQKGNYLLEKNKRGEFEYYSAKYIWVVDKSFENLIIYNE